MATRRRASRRTITGSLSDIDRRLKFVETRPSPSRLANQVVRRTNIQPRAVSTDQIQLLSITNSLIEKRTVGEAELAENSVTGLQVAPQAITSESFAPSAVNNAAMGTNSVATDNVQDESITENKLADGAASSDKIENGAITSEKLADGSVTEPKLASNAVTESKINSGAVTESKIALQAVTAGKIASGAVTDAKIGNGAVSTAKIANLAVTGGKIATGAVGQSQLASNAVITSRVAGGTTIATDVTGGSGISVSRSDIGNGSRYTVSAAFGGGFSNVPRGNHRHTNSITTTSTGSALSGNDAHDHSYFRAGGTVSTPTSSTKKVKKDISNYKIKDPEKILKLQPKKFRYKESKREIQDSQHRDWMYGYIAEEVQEAGVEEILGYDKDGQVDSVNYGLLSILLLELVKKQQKELDELKLKIRSLK